MDKLKDYDQKILKLLDEILLQKQKGKVISNDIKNKINSLSDQELLELIQLHTDIHIYQESKEKKPVPEFFMFQIKDYYAKQKHTTTDVPVLVVQFFKNQLQILKNTIQHLSIQETPIASYRNKEKIECNKIILTDPIQKDQYVEFSLIPQEDSLLLSIFLMNLSGSLTLKLTEGNRVINTQHFSNMERQKRIDIENLKTGNYIIDMRGAYEQVFALKIQ